jgi:hypothetical protein
VKRALDVDALLLVFGDSVVPGLIGEVAAEEASHRFRPRVLTVEEPTRLLSLYQIPE